MWGHQHKKVFHTRPMPTSQWAELNQRQEQVEGYKFADYQGTRIGIVGLGGLGTHIASALIRQGPGELILIDHDTVEASNLTRVALFNREDLGKFKAWQAGLHLSREGLFETKITAWNLRFVEMVEQQLVGLPDLIICSVDNSPTRRAVTLYGLAHAIRVIHVAVGIDANAVSVFVQEPGGPCWACAYPEQLNDFSYPCSLPGIVDVLQIAAGVVVFAVGSLLSGRHREWNVRSIYLDAAMPDRARIVERQPNCPLCGNGATAARVNEPVAAPAQRWWNLGRT